MIKKKAAIILMVAIMAVSYVGMAAMPAFGESQVLYNKHPSNAKMTVNDVSGKVGFDNSSYFNDAIVSDARSFQSDEIDVIVRLAGDSLMEKYDSAKFKTVAEYAVSQEGRSYLGKLAAKQNGAIKAISGEISSLTVGVRYSTVLNGFSARIKASDYSALSSLADVKGVIVQETYDVPQTEDYGALKDYLAFSNGATQNKVDAQDTGIFDSSNVGYDGQGMLVAILDTGCDVNHSVFKKMPLNPGRTSQDIEEIYRDTNAYDQTGSEVDSFYVNEKFPYVYDYADKDNNVYPAEADHGLHVAGIIGGQDDVVTGVAVNAQLAIMKVFTDAGNATTEGILAALEDCVTLGVDVINMSLGASCGFSRESDESEMNDVYDGVRDAGINLVVAASNSYSSSYGSKKGNTNLVSNPDSGTVGSPATYDGAFAVASISGQLSPYFMADGITAAYFTEAFNLDSTAYDFVSGLLKGADSAEYQYVAVPGNGAAYDYAGIDIKGKIALVKRGDINFTDKMRNAYAKGAVGCIIYNNVSGTIRMSVENLLVPTCSITMDAGKAMAERGSGTIKLSKNFAAGPFMSDFSSWGPLPNLEIKPEITAHGGSIYSAYRNGYSSISGTSMASPNMAGAVTLVKQYVKQAFPELSATEQSALVNTLLMSTANIALNEAGNPYSPRKQGAGLGSISNAVNTGAYIYVDGISKPKIELGDDPAKKGEYTLTFHVKNFSDKALTYIVSPYVMTETVSSDLKTVAEMAYMLDDCDIKASAVNGTMKGSELTVAAGADAEVTVQINLSSAAKSYINKNFVNGMYVEGFVELISKNTDGINLSVPYLSFFGDWTKAPIFDVDAYEVSADEVDESINAEDKLQADVYATQPVGLYNNGYYLMPLGTYVYKQPDEAKKVLSSVDKISISYYANSIYALYSCYTGLLRGAKEMTYNITNTLTGERVTEETVKYNARKVRSDNGVQIPYGEMVGISPYGEKLANNTQYTFTMNAALDYGDGGKDTNLKNSYSFTFYVDFEAPRVIEDQCEFRKEFDKDANKFRYYADLALYDNQYVMAYMPGVIKDRTLYPLTTYYQPVYDGVHAGVSKVTVELTDHWDDIQNNQLGLVLQDYAMNQSIVSVHIPENLGRDDLESLTIDETALTLKKGETKQLTMHKVPDDAWTNDLVYTFEDSSIADAYRGEVRGLKEGTTKLTVTSPLDENYAHVINVTVTDEVSDVNVPLNKMRFTGYEIFGGGSTGSDDMYLSEMGYNEVYPTFSVRMKLKLEPWNATGVDVVWSASPEKYVDVQSDGTITFLDNPDAEDKTITVRAKYKSYSASAVFKLKSSFKVDNNNLQHYYGTAENLVLPDDQSIYYIDSGAFANNTTLKSVTINAKTMQIKSQAFYKCLNLEKVVLSGDVELIGSGAFYGCTSLVSVDSSARKTGFNVDSSAFQGCFKLSDFDFTNVTGMGANAFYECKALKSVDITNLRKTGEYAFYKCEGLTEIVMGEHTALGSKMFSNCKALMNVRIPVSDIPDGLFDSCTGLTTVTVTGKIGNIGNQAFTGCTSLTNVTFRQSVESIGQQAFKNCSELTKFKFPAGLKTVGHYAFDSCTSLMVVEIDKDAIVEELSPTVFDKCSAFEEVRVATGSKTLATDSFGVLYRLDGENKISEVVLIPKAANLNGYTLPSTISKIGYGSFAYRGEVTDLDLTNVTEIGDYAFYACSGITRVTLGEGLKKIGAYAFAVQNIAAGNLDAIVIPSSVEEIGGYAFYSRTSATITFADPDASMLKEINEGAFSAIGNTTIELPTGLKKIGNEAFYYCQKLENITVPAGVTVMGDKVFRLCAALKTVNLPAVEEMGEYTFMDSCALEEVTYADGALVTGDYTFAPRYTVDDWGNVVVLETTLHKQLKTVNLPESLERVGAYAFWANTELENIDLTHVLQIDAFAFSDCTQLTELNLDSLLILGTNEFLGHERISQSFFNCTGLKSVRMPVATNIYEAAFYGCTELTSVYMPNVNYIGISAFYNCTKMLDCDFSNARTIDAFAFYMNSALTEMELPNLTGLGASAFFYCGNLTSVDMPLVEIIGERAFFKCNKLNEVKAPVAKEIYPQAFYNTALTEYEIPKTTIKVGAGAFGACFQLKALSVAENNEKFFAEDGVLYEKLPAGGYQLDCYPSGKKGASYTILDKTVRLDEYSFVYANNLETVVMDYDLKSIGASAFYKCGNIRAYEFNSYIAPVLEARIDEEQERSLYYDNFYDLIGSFSGIFMSSPVNGQGYDNFLFNTYFVHSFLSAEVPETYTKTVIDFIDELPDAKDVTEYSDELMAMLTQAKDLYNGIAKESNKVLVKNASKIVELEEKLNLLKETPPVDPHPTEPESGVNLIVGLCVTGALVIACGVWTVMFNIKCAKKDKSDGCGE